MAKQPENLVLDILRDIRADIRGLREESVRHGDELESIRKVMNDWQETTATATGFAMHANLKLETVDQRLDDPTRRIESLEAER